MNLKDSLRTVNRAKTVPVLHGHTKITLTNPDGSKEIIEKDNIVTDLAQNIFSHDVNGVIDYSKLLPLTKLFSGCMLFNAPEGDYSEEQVFIPNGATLVAHAGDEAYTGLDRTAGSPNLIESGEVTNGYRFVWDWQTSQGNGTINCVGLTLGTLGMIGRPILLEGERKTMVDIGAPWLAQDGTQNIPVTEPIILCQLWDWDTSRTYHIKLDETGANILIDVYHAPLKNIGLLDDMYRFKYLETIETGIPAQYMSSNNMLGSVSKIGDIIYLVAPIENTSANTFRLATFNVKTREKTTTESLAPNIDGKITFMSMLEYKRTRVANDLYPIINGYIYLKKVKTADDAGIRYYKVNLNNMADVTLVEAHDTEVADFGEANNNGGVVLPNGTYITNNHLIINDEIYPSVNYSYLNTGIQRYFGGVSLGNSGVVINRIGHRDDRRRNWYINLSIPVDAISTINQLTTPVVKGADQTMKLEYTITLEE